MVAGLLGNESSDSNRFTLVTPKSENDVRLQATLGNQNPTGLPVGVVRSTHTLLKTAEALGVTQYDLTGTAEDLEIVNIGRFVKSTPVLLNIIDMLKNGVVTDVQLQKVVEVITSLK